MFRSGLLSRMPSTDPSFDLSSAMKSVAAPVVVNTIEPKTDLYLLLPLFRSGTTMAGQLNSDVVRSQKKQRPEEA